MSSHDDRLSFSVLSGSTVPPYTVGWPSRSWPLLGFTVGARRPDGCRCSPQRWGGTPGGSSSSVLPLNPSPPSSWPYAAVAPGAWWAWTPGCGPPGPLSPDSHAANIGPRTAAGTETYQWRCWYGGQRVTRRSNLRTKPPFLNVSSGNLVCVCVCTRSHLYVHGEMETFSRALMLRVRTRALGSSSRGTVSTVFLCVFIKCFDWLPGFGIAAASVIIIIIIIQIIWWRGGKKHRTWRKATRQMLNWIRSQNLHSDSGSEFEVHVLRINSEM